MSSTSNPPPPDGFGASSTPQPFQAIGHPGYPPAVPGPPPGMVPVAGAPLGKVRGTGGCVLLTIVTLGFYTWYWYYKTHDEMKRHSGTGLGGGVALVLAIFVG